MKRIITFLFSTLWLAAGIAFAQPERPFIKNFSNRDYGKNINPETYCITQDSNGVVYSGTANGIITYNGSRWGFINLIHKHITYVLSLDFDKNGKLFVGSLGNFGYLSSGNTGLLEYTSLSDSITEMFGAIHRTYCIGDYVYFQSEEAVFVYDGKTVKTVIPSSESTFHLGFPFQNGLLIRERGTGLWKIEGTTKQWIEGTGFFAEIGIFGVLEKSEFSALILTQEAGIWSYTYPNHGTPSEIKRIPYVAEQEIVGSKPYGFTRGKDDDVIINTLENGLLILPGECNAALDSANLNVQIYKYDKRAGLKVNDIKDASLDAQGNLWLATNNGISLVNYSSPFSYFRESSGLTGDVEAISSNGKMVGTSDGLFNKDGNHYIQSRLHSQIWDIYEHNNAFIIASVDGLYLTETGSDFRLISSGSFNNITKVKDNLILAAGPGGILVFNNDLKLLKTIDFPFGRTTTIARDPVFNNIWVGTAGLGVIRIFEDFSFDIYGELDGLDIRWVNPINFNDSIYFGTASGLQYFIDEDKIKATLPDSLANNPDNYRGYFDIAPLQGRLMVEAINLILTVNKKTLINMDDHLAYFTDQSILTDTSFVSSPFNPIDFGRLNIAEQTESKIYLGYSEGLLSFDIDQIEIPKYRFNCLIDSIFLNRDSIISPLRSYDEIAYPFNTISFQFSAPFYEGNQPVQFTHKLEGYESVWSPWTSDSKLRYNDLKEGDYILYVKSRNIYGRESSIAQFRFSILPPWYRSFIAYIGYILLLVFLIYAIVKVSLARLKAQNEVLEKIVAERTKEVVHQKEIIEEKHKEITDSINYAQRIQRALMQADEQWNRISDDYFVLFKPRDVVSGDFYWAYQNEDIAIWVAADCTGHGVPGAFMSMLGIGFLNEIVIESGHIEADTILNTLRTKIIKSLEQKGSNDQRKDGMDIALCVLDKQNNNLQFAGAYNPLFIVRKTELISEELINNEALKVISEGEWSLIELKASKMPVGKHILDQEPFQKINFKLQSNDRIYSFSDGFPDQFGGESGKKYMTKRFKRTLLSIQEMGMETQKTTLNGVFADWLREGNTEQIDDVCVVGVKIL